MRVLVMIATYPTEPAMHPLTRASVAGLLPPLSGDGTPGEVVVWEAGEDLPGLSHYERLVVKHNAGRARVLAEGFDALLSVEADMVLPPDALRRLAGVIEDGAAEVAYGLYCSRSSQMWLLFEAISPTGGTSLSADPARAAAVWGQVVPSAGVGMGCTLIARRALEVVEFRLGAERVFADDWQFALDVAAAGLRQAHDTGVVCGHVLESAGGRATVVWPDMRREPDGERWALHRVEVREDGAVMAASRSDARYVAVQSLYLAGSNRYVKPGEVVLLGEDAARVLMRAEAVAPAPPVAQPPAGRRRRTG